MDSTISPLQYLAKADPNYWYSCEGEIELFPLCCVSCKIVKRFAASAKGWRNLIGLSRELLPSLL